MELPFTLSNTLNVGQHQFKVYDVCNADNADWLRQLADEYRKLLNYWGTDLAKVKEGMSDIPMGTSDLEKFIYDASIPELTNSQLNVVRSDFGELLSYLILEYEHQTLFGPKSICYRELKDHTARGIDAIGVENDDILTLVLCEVKVSNEKSSPPRVVDANKDSLKQQHKFHLEHLSNETYEKVERAARLSKDELTSRLLLRASIYLHHKVSDKLRIILCNVLVRPVTKYKITDFGSFKEEPEQYSPAIIRFLIPCIPDEVDAIIKRWYDILQEAGTLNE